jgi:cytochrome c-type biogenesis protein CcmH/NrfG
MSRHDALEHKKTGPCYKEIIDVIAKHAGSSGESTQAVGAWNHLVAASKAEDPETASIHVIRALMHRASTR